ncbi:DEAD/DEAH box helicase family protein [Streptomonospora wellingtoniae]|uniref:AAA+ ATPase domain-containing protein n=1 Tax=Streptomonospora wellingtoniae TaxID=3075544 RepID=A0ABU2KN31_9ACTN|nr:hypothetical protein [Streptomonospora sp. DSM 45055]MDT0300607.1 hypothetical protein [Streptomonospora sp. DSM 45055]
MTTTSATLQDLTAQIACALGEALFATRREDGTVAISIEQAHIFAAGRMDLWEDWPKQPEPVPELVGRFLRIRHNDLGAPKRFREAVLSMAQSPDSPFHEEQVVDHPESSHVVAVHGQPPLELAESLLVQAEGHHAASRRPLPLAPAGTWGFGWEQLSTVDIPDPWEQSTATPPALTTAPALDTLTVAADDLRVFLERSLTTQDGSLWQAEVLHTLLKQLRDHSGAPVAQITLTSGSLRLLNAPTGVGKSVFTRALALYLADQGITVAIAVGTINEALTTEDKIRAEAQEAQFAAEQIERSGTDLGVQTGVMISPSRLWEKATQAAARDDWDRFDRVAYGCELAAYVTDGPAPHAGQEPCTSLRNLTPDDTKSNPTGPKAPRQALCPRIHSCTRHRGVREATTADILVVNHHNLMHGTVRAPLTVDGTLYGRLSVLEFVMRRCQVLLIDEIDLCQSNMFDTSAQQLLLAANGAATTSPLTRLDGDRGRLAPATDRQIMPALSRTRFLAEQFLNYVLEHEIWLEDDPSRPSSGWHIPGSNDRSLLYHLFDIDTDNAPGPEAYRQFNALFPDADGAPASPPVPLPSHLAEVARLLRSAVSNDTGKDELRDIKHHLAEALKKRVPTPKTRSTVVNLLLIRAWLGSLHQALTRLTFAASASSGQLPAAGELAGKLGTFVQHAAIPYGPLGQLLFGFKIDKSNHPGPQGQLSAQVIAGDPHTTTAQVGDTVALAAAGTRRIVLGLSATAFFPGAAREHIHTEPTYAMTDAAPGAFTTLRGDTVATTNGEDTRPIRISGLVEADKAVELERLGASLWDQRLDAHLANLAEADPNRERALVVGNSYRHAALLASGIARQADEPAWVAVVVPKEHGRLTTQLPPGVVRITIEEIEDLPRTHPNVKVCTAPLGLVSRSINILVPGEQRSALASIWVCARPFAQLNDPAEMFASVNNRALRIGTADSDPAAILKEQHQAAHRHLRRLLASDTRFSRIPRNLKAEILAGIMVDLIQLAGRARRGGTPVELYLVDHAFHDTRLGSDVPGILAFYYNSLTDEDAAAMQRIYGSTLSSWLDFAKIVPLDAKEAM